MKNEKKDLKYFLELNYEVVHQMSGASFFVYVPILGKHSTCACGKTLEEALENLEEVKKMNFSRWLEQGHAIPEPLAENLKEFSGSISLRVPPEVQSLLNIAAKMRNISVNSLINKIISGEEKSLVFPTLSRVA